MFYFTFDTERCQNQNMMSMAANVAVQAFNVGIHVY